MKKVHRCESDRTKVRELLAPKLPLGWAVHQEEDGSGVGYLWVTAPDGWSKTIYGRKETGRGWHAREAARLKIELWTEHFQERSPPRTVLDRMIDKACGLTEKQ